MFFRGGGQGFLAGSSAVARQLAPGAVALGSLDVSAGQLLIGDGALATPGLAFKNATNTGMWRSTSMRLAHTGVDKIQIGASNTGCPQTVTTDSTLSVAGSLVLQAETIKTADYQIVNGDTWIIMNGAALTATFPASPTSNSLVFIKNLDAGNLTVARNTKNIDGAAANDTIAGGKAKLYGYNSTNTSWYILAQF